MNQLSEIKRNLSPFYSSILVRRRCVTLDAINALRRSRTGSTAIRRKLAMCSQWRWKEPQQQLARMSFSIVSFL